MATSEVPNGLAGFPDFVWSVGEEGSDPIVDKDGRPHRIDQYAASGHYDQMERDLRDIASLGVDVVRYGMPWRLAEPEHGTYDWAIWDRALAACESAGVEPIVDLLHFGLPDHYPGFADAAWTDGFCRYVDAFLARYGDMRWFTPINEPGITARFSALYGLWNDRLTTPEDHARVLGNVVLANLEAISRVQADPRRAWIASEGFDVAVALTAADEPEAARRRANNWLVWDMHLGRDPLPEAAGYLDAISDDVRGRIETLAVTNNVLAGHDIYPVGIQPVTAAQPAWSVEDRVGFVGAELERWHDRYGLPFWVAETSNLSLPITDQVPWLDALVDELQRLGRAGRPVRGVCWYSRGDQFDWQTALTNPTGQVTPVGLFDTDRNPRPSAARFAGLAATPAPGG